MLCSFGERRRAASTARPRQCWTTSETTRSLRSLYSLGPVGKPMGRERCVHAWYSYSLHGVIKSRSRRSWMSNEAHIQFESMTGQVVDSCKMSSYALLFNGLQRLVARVERERSPGRPHSVRTVQPYDVRGRCLCLSGASRLHVGGPVVSEMDRSKHLGWYGGARALGGVVYSDFKVAAISFAF